MNTGYLFALGAFGLWGVTPIYFKLIGHLDPIDIVANRILWSSILLACIISLISKWRTTSAIRHE